MSKGKPHILLAEDDVNLSYLVIENLAAKGFEITHVQDGTAGIDAIGKDTFDLCIFDVMMPGVDGFSLAKTLVSHNKKIPFLFLTARGMEGDKLLGFEIGADDYITKPFSFKELFARIQVILRRKTTASTPGNELLELGNLSLKPDLRMLRILDTERKLSQRESELLAILLRNAGTYVPRAEILKYVWGNDDYFTTKSMDVYVTRLRKLLKEGSGIEIENLYGSGYRVRLTEVE